MALNKNHEFEELDGQKCGIVEKNVSPERLDFLREILESNGLTVVAVPSPPPKAAAKAATPALGSEMEAATASAETATAATSATYTVGVTDYTFNWVNAIFGRQLRTRDGQFVTLAYWQQQDTVNNDEIPYYEHPL